MNPVSHTSPHQIITSPLDAGGKGKEIRCIKKPLQGAAGGRSVSPAEVCDAALGISTGRDTGVTKPAGHTVLSYKKKTEQNTAQGVTVAISATSSSEQIQSQLGLKRVGRLENLVLTETEKEGQAVGTTLGLIIDKLEDVILEEAIKDDHHNTTTVLSLKTIVDNLKSIVAGPVDTSKKEEMRTLITVATSLKDKGQLQETDQLLKIVTEYTKKNHDHAISKQLRQLHQLKGDSVSREKEIEEPLFFQESGKLEALSNFRSKVAELSSTLGIDVLHENRQLEVFDPIKFYQDIQRLLTADEKHQERVPPEIRAFYNALEMIFEEEGTPGTKTSRNPNTYQPKKATGPAFQSAIKNASKEFPFADDILKFASNIRLIKRGRHQEARLNVHMSQSSDVFKHLDTYITCEAFRAQGLVREAVAQCKTSIKNDRAPFSDYLKSLEHDYYGDEECG